MLFFFFFNDTATTEIYTLSLHDALPICEGSFPDSSVFSGLDSSLPIHGTGWTSALGIAQWRALNVDGMAVVAEATQERFGHGPVAQEVRPFVIHEIGCDDCGVATIALLHQFEEDVGLFRL